MSINIKTPWGIIDRPVYYGPRCLECNAPITFDKFRQKNAKCDTCNGFIVHCCSKSYDMKYDPNVQNGIRSEFWLDNQEWWGELDYSNDSSFYTSQHFKLLFCPFCGIELKTLV